MDHDCARSCTIFKSTSNTAINQCHGVKSIDDSKVHAVNGDLNARCAGGVKNFAVVVKRLSPLQSRVMLDHVRLTNAIDSCMCVIRSLGVWCRFFRLKVSASSKYEFRVVGTKPEHRVKRNEFAIIGVGDICEIACKLR